MTKECYIIYHSDDLEKYRTAKYNKETQSFYFEKDSFFSGESLSLIDYANLTRPALKSMKEAHKIWNESFLETLSQKNIDPSILPLEFDEKGAILVFQDFQIFLDISILWPLRSKITGRSFPSFQDHKKRMDYPETNREIFEERFATQYKKNRTKIGREQVANFSLDFLLTEPVYRGLTVSSDEQQDASSKLNDALTSNNGVIFSEQHGQTNEINFVTNNMATLEQHGCTIFLEHLNTNTVGPYLEMFFQGKLSDEQLSHFLPPHAYKSELIRLLEAAKQHNVLVSPGSHTYSMKHGDMRDSGGKILDEMDERILRFNAVLSALMNKCIEENRKVIVIQGGAHSNSYNGYEAGTFPPVPGISQIFGLPAFRVQLPALDQIESHREDKSKWPEGNPPTTTSRRFKKFEDACQKIGKMLSETVISVEMKPTEKPKNTTPTALAKMS